VLGALARLAFRRARWILAATAVFAALAGIVGGPVAGLMKTSPGANFRDPGSESVTAQKLLERWTGVDPDVGVVARVEPSQRPRVERALRAERTIARVRPLDGRYLVAFFRPVNAEERKNGAERLLQRLGGEPGVLLGGAAVAGSQISELVQRDLLRSELIAFPLLLLLSFWVFRGVVAALLPPLVGAVTVAGTLLVLRGVVELTQVSIFALNLVTGLGLGLAIDYSLLVVSRYREELERNGPGLEALRRTLATAGRTILFSALTVAAALAALMVFPQRFLYSMGIGGILTPLLAAATALVALPAALALLGPRVNALAPARWQRPPSGGGWERLARLVMRRPALVAAGAAGLLIALGLPSLGIRFTGVDASVLPRETSARLVADAVARDFDPSRTSPVYVAVDGATKAQVSRYAVQLSGLAPLVVPPQRLGAERWRIDLYSGEKALAPASRRLVRAVRALDPPFAVSVGGAAAAFEDQQASLKDRLPWALGLVATTTLVLLFLLTGSVVLPLKALLMNALTLSAAFGLLVLVFQQGRLEGLLGYEGQGALESTQPILLFAIAFGLSTDYGVFLISRIKEGWDAGEANSDAVAHGLERTGRIVTAAALLFVVAISAFSISRIVFIKELTVGMGVAVALDASIVRALLVPSLMALLGRWNWWAPGPLRRLHERLGLGES
jgi:RND superfamily putative drug exporter